MANTFDVDGEAVATRDFIHDGTKYRQGRPFPHRELGVIPLDLQGLHLAELIRFTGRKAELDPKLKRRIENERAERAERLAMKAAKPTGEPGSEPGTGQGAPVPGGQTGAPGAPDGQGARP